jgi:predicted NUDIX family NTP pyrophosphohydrolase
MGAESAGILMYRRGDGGRLEVFLVHPGGPFFRNRDEGAWGIPKGLVEEGENPRAAALRELEEETGLRPGSELLELGSVRQKGGKTVRAWAVHHDSPGSVEPRSNSFALEWPPRSGCIQEFPEIDRGEFFELEEARRKINPSQAELLDRLVQALE